MSTIDVLRVGYASYLEKSDELSKKYDNLKDMASSISISDLENADYNDLKFLDPLFNFKYSNPMYKLYEQIYQKKRTERYPQLLKVHYIPLINEIYGLSEEEKVDLDKFLGKYKQGQYIRPRTLYRGAGHLDVISAETWEKLRLLGIVERYYVYMPECDCEESEGVYVSQKEYDNLITYFRADISKMTNSEYMEFREKYYTEICVVCNDCDTDFSVEDEDDLNHYSKILYKLVVEPDLSWNKL